MRGMGSLFEITYYYLQNATSASGFWCTYRDGVRQRSAKDAFIADFQTAVDLGGVVAVHELYASMADLTIHRKMIGAVAPAAGEESLYPCTAMEALFAEVNSAASYDVAAAHFGHNVAT